MPLIGLAASAAFLYGLYSLITGASDNGLWWIGGAIVLAVAANLR